MNASIVRCDEWFDGSWWEAEAPGTWIFRRDRTVHGFPYVFESPNESMLIIADRKNIMLSELRISAAPAELPHEQKVAYVLAKTDAKSKNTKKDFSMMTPEELANTQHALVQDGDSPGADDEIEIRQFDIGQLKGFVYDRSSSDTRAWAGFISHGPWMLHVRFHGPTSAASDFDTAMSILQSMLFHSGKSVD